MEFKLACKPPSPAVKGRQGRGGCSDFDPFTELCRTGLVGAVSEHCQLGSPATAVAQASHLWFAPVGRKVHSICPIAGRFCGSGALPPHPAGSPGEAPDCRFPMKIENVEPVPARSLGVWESIAGEELLPPSAYRKSTIGLLRSTRHGHEVALDQWPAGDHVWRVVCNGRMGEGRPEDQSTVGRYWSFP